MFATALNAATNVDIVTDFSHADDTIRLSKTVFAAFAGQPTDTNIDGGALARFGAATEVDDRILYKHLDGPDADTAADTLWLYYDANGGDRSDAVLFAKLQNPLTFNLDASDFLIVA